MRIFVMVIGIVFMLGGVVEGQEGGSGNSSIKETLGCGKLSLDAAKDAFRQQCLKELYYGQIIQGMLASGFTGQHGGTMYSTSVFGVSSMETSYFKPRLDNMVKNAWDYAEQMVEKRNESYYEEVKE